MAHKKMSHGDAMAANAGMSDYSSKGMHHVSTKSNYAVSGLSINPTGEYASTAHRKPAGDRMGALDQMSNGSMNYLAHEDAKFSHNVKRIRKQKIDSVEM
jgi:hypothetical protein